LAAPRRHVAVPARRSAATTEVAAGSQARVSQHHILLGPQRDHRLVPGPAVIGPVRGPLLALEDGGIDIDRRHRLRPPLLQKADQLATGLRQALEALAFALHLAGLALPERRHR